MTESIFSGYARLYDAIYADKDYVAESEFVLNRLVDAGGAQGALLELGAGTGRHLLEFAKAGMQVVGVDLSAEMVVIASERLRAQQGAVGQSQVIQADIRSLRLGRTFSSAVSLFHVMSYIVDEADLEAALGSIRSHLSIDGCLLFDFWHLPGVLRDPPARRTRSFRVGENRIERRVFPDWTAKSSCVGLDIEIDGIWDGSPVRVRERHSLRAWDAATLQDKLAECGFSVLKWGGGLAERPLDESEWTGWVLARAM